MTSLPVGQSQAVIAVQALSTGPVAQTAANALPGADPDHDGIPNAVDVDDNENGNIDAIDATDPTTPTQSSGAGLFSTLFLGYQQALNADAGSVTRSDIDVVFPTNFNMVFYYSLPPSGPTYDSADVNCLALVYCRAGAGTAIYTGLSESPPPSEGLAWIEFNANGHPNNLVHLSGAWAVGILPQVTTASISSGDTYGLNFRNGSGTTTALTSLSPYFVTTPAISQWQTTSDSETVSYPITDPRGTDGTPAAIGADGTLTMSLWRPQRMAIAGAEPGTFVDMGHLHYGLTITAAGTSAGEHGCGANFSGLSATLQDHSVTPPSDPQNLFPLLDTAADAAPDAANQLAFTVDLAGCLADAGVSNPAGHTVRVTVTAATDGRSGGMDRAAQTFTVQFPS